MSAGQPVTPAPRALALVAQLRWIYSTSTAVHAPLVLEALTILEQAVKDETTTYLFDDGTEPTVRRLPKGCDQQGRFPEAAEAATEVGADDAPVGIGSIVLRSVKAIIIVGVIAFLVGVLA